MQAKIIKEKKHQPTITQTGEYKQWYNRIKSSLPQAPTTLEELKKKQKDDPQSWIAPVINTS